MAAVKFCFTLFLANPSPLPKQALGRVPHLLTNNEDGCLPALEGLAVLVGRRYPDNE